MGFHNPFIKDGLIKFPDNGSLVLHVERWAKVRGDKLAYRFLDFSTERDGVGRDLNWADFGRRNRAVGARLQQVTEPGDRVAILCPQNLEYLVAFFGTLYSGRIAVPLFDPSEPGHVGRLHAVIDDCHPSAILTTTESAEGVRKFFRSRPAKERPRVIAVDAVPDEVGATWEPVDVEHDTIAYLQYTSGSTRIPTGVQITHLNLATNVVQVIEALEGEEGDRGVSWLPFFHDMGLITAMISPMIGHYVDVHDARGVRPQARPLDPRDGAQARRHRRRDLGGAELRLRPRRGARPAQGRRAAAGPVSVVKCILNGSEPISAATVRRFNEAFGPYGFQPQAIKPSYGLAEATLFVSTTPMGDHPKIVYVDRDALNTGTLRRGARGFAERRRAGRRGQGRRRRVGRHRRRRDRHRTARRPDRRGLDQRPEHGHRLLGQEGRDRRDLPEHPEVADQPVARRGRDRRRARGCAPATTAPTTTASSTSPAASRISSSSTAATTTRRTSSTRRRSPRKALRTGFVAAFSVPANQLPDEVFDNAHAGLKRDPDDTSEQLVIVGERAPGAHKMDMAPITDDIRAAIAVRHGVTVRDVLLTPAGAIPRTSSGKIGRRACRAAYLDGSLRSGKVANAFPDETD